MSVGEAEVRPAKGMTRRDLLQLIGKVAGAAPMYSVMTTLGHAQPSPFEGELTLSQAPAGASVIVLGAGLAGMTAAHELRKAGYQVHILEYTGRPGGRTYTIHSGDQVTDLAGETQHCTFSPGNYFNPGPWRIPYHHHAILHYCKQFGVRLEPFIQTNFNAYLHSPTAFDGKPRRMREILTDVQGHTSELLAKASTRGALDDVLTPDDIELLIEQLRAWGHLSEGNQYTRNLRASYYRGFEDWPAGGLMPRPSPSTPLDFKALLHSGLWAKLLRFFHVEFQQTLFQPVGGMDQIAQGFAKSLGGLIEYRSKVIGIRQSDRQVTVSYVSTDQPQAVRSRTADWCVCTIPLSILSQIELDASKAMLQAIQSIPYADSVKVGLEFKRRFWEQDENIYGGVTYTNLPITTIGYPSTGYFDAGPAVLLGAYTSRGASTYAMAALSARDRIAAAMADGKQIHPQYEEEFLSGISWSWYRCPWTLGCWAEWTDMLRAKYYDTLCRIDHRLILAGEHCSYMPAWQEGAVLSGMDAVRRLHTKAVSLA